MVPGNPGMRTSPPPCAHPPALTHPDAEAHGQGQARRAPMQGTQREDRHVPAVHAHSGQGGACGLHRDLEKPGVPACALVFDPACLPTCPTTQAHMGSVPGGIIQWPGLRGSSGGTRGGAEGGSEGAMGEVPDNPSLNPDGGREPTEAAEAGCPSPLFLHPVTPTTTPCGSTHPSAPRPRLLPDSPVLWGPPASRSPAPPSAPAECS